MLATAGRELAAGGLFAPEHRRDLAVVDVEHVVEEERFTRVDDALDDRLRQVFDLDAEVLGAGALFHSHLLRGVGIDEHDAGALCSSDLDRVLGHALQQVIQTGSGIHAPRSREDATECT